MSRMESVGRWLFWAWTVFTPAAVIAVVVLLILAVTDGRWGEVVGWGLLLAFIGPMAVWRVWKAPGLARWRGSSVQARGDPDSMPGD